MPGTLRNASDSDVAPCASSSARSTCTTVCGAAASSAPLSDDNTLVASDAAFNAEGPDAAAFKTALSANAAPEIALSVGAEPDIGPARALRDAIGNANARHNAAHKGLIVTQDCCMHLPRIGSLL